RELDPLAGEAGADPERDRQMRLAGPRRAQHDHVLLRMAEVELAEVLDHGLAHRALEGEVELLQRLSGREASRLDPVLAAVGLPLMRPRPRARLPRSARATTPPRALCRRA